MLETPGKKDMEVLHSFISDAWLFELEKDIKLKTAELRKAYKTKLPDAIIAATALVHHLTLLTRNISDLKNVLELQVVNPHER